jgi:hydrogenase maturation protein HypF
MRNGDAIKEAIKLIASGGFVAVKGLGGFHITCDATNDDAVKRLRDLKRKSNKPFAVMAPDIRNIEKSCHISETEKDLLQSSRRPIVLLRKLDGRVLSAAVSPNNNYIGCMLPYTPLHYLFFSDVVGASEINFNALS